jgi:hypothetical protein
MVGKHRRIKTVNRELSNVEDFSINGKGEFIPNTKIKVNIFGYDVNNRDSALTQAQALAYRRMAQEHLAAAGFANPIEVVEELYKKHLPGDKEFE